MTQQAYYRVVTALKPLAAVYGTLRDQAMDVYARKLSHYSEETLDAAVETVLETYTQQKFPSIATIWKGCEEAQARLRPVFRESYIPCDKEPVPEGGEENAESAMRSALGTEAIRRECGQYFHDSVLHGMPADGKTLDVCVDLKRSHREMAKDLAVRSSGGDALAKALLGIWEGMLLRELDIAATFRSS